MERITTENLSQVSGVAHGFYTRKGGVSKGFFSSANFSLRPPELAENVKENHRLLLQDMGGGFKQTIVLSQKHTNKVVFVDEEWDNRVKSDKTLLVADGLITQRKNILIGVLTADCVPLLIAARDASVVAAIHVGWRGALDGIVDSALKALLKIVPADSLVASLGPCLQQHHFEVGPEFLSAFLQKHMSSRGFFLRKENKIFFNLDAFIRFQLQAHSVSNVKLCHLDTYSDPDRFFSYRRTTHKNETSFGCQISVIGIKSA